MSTWNLYPSTYRQAEIAAITRAARAGACTLVTGPSGSGKSNLLGFLTHRVALPDVDFHLIDCNRLQGMEAQAFWHLLSELFNGANNPQQISQFLEDIFNQKTGGLCLCLDRFEVLPGTIRMLVDGGLRALRDQHKYRLTYVVASRQTFEPSSELYELFTGSQVWLGPLSADDARWSIRAYAARAGLSWDLTTIDQIMAISGGYPAFLRGVCEAAVSNTPLVPSALRDHPAVKLRLDEFWADAPAPGVLSRCGLSTNPLLQDAQAALDNTDLTAKEALLLAALRARPGQLISKDDLICAVWPEDQVYELGLRDDSLAQLVRRLRQKVGKDRIASVIGRGYRWIKDE